MTFSIGAFVHALLPGTQTKRPAVVLADRGDGRADVVAFTAPEDGDGGGAVHLENAVVEDLPKATAAPYGTTPPFATTPTPYGTTPVTPIGTSPNVVTLTDHTTPLQSQTTPPQV